MAPHTLHDMYCTTQTAQNRLHNVDSHFKTESGSTAYQAPHPRSWDVRPPLGMCKNMRFYFCPMVH
eukprot:3490210-Pyramimonas_sp.AAC.1